MVGVRGLEPPTSASRTLRASQLRHTPLLQSGNPATPGCYNETAKMKIILPVNR